MRASGGNKQMEDGREKKKEKCVIVERKGEKENNTKDFMDLRVYLCIMFFFIWILLYLSRSICLSLCYSLLPCLFSLLTHLFLGPNTFSLVSPHILPFSHPLDFPVFCPSLSKNFFPFYYTKGVSRVAIVGNLKAFTTSAPSATKIYRNDLAFTFYLSLSLSVILLLPTGFFLLSFPVHSSLLFYIFSLFFILSPTFIRISSLSLLLRH